MDTNDRSHPVRLALVGVGGHGRMLQHAAEAADNVQVAAVYDVDEDELRQAAERFGCAAAASYEALMERDDLDAVVLATPNHLHRPQAEAAFDAGLDVLVEKPIANTVADGQAMADAADRAGCLLMVGHNMRRSRSARKTRRLLDEGRLGNIVSAEIHFSTDSVRHLSDDAWRLRPDQCPLLPVMQLGIHAIDLVHYFFDPIEEVYALTRSVTTPSEVVDSVAATFRTVSGIQGTIISNYCTQVTFEYRLAGTEATVKNQTHRLWYRTVEATNMDGSGPAEVNDYSAYRRESYVRQMEAFGEAVRDGTHPETGARVGLQALAVVEALQRSAEAHASQSVPVLNEAETT